MAWDYRKSNGQSQEIGFEQVKASKVAHAFASAHLTCSKSSTVQDDDYQAVCCESLSSAGEGRDEDERTRSEDG